jgi:hypothetical protein
MVHRRSDDDAMAQVTRAELEAIRQSLEAGATVRPDELLRVVETLSQLLYERVQIEQILAGLSPSVPQVRAALSEARLVMERSDQAAAGQLEIAG